MTSTDEVHVVIDVMMFSSSVISLLDSGVSSVIPVHPDDSLEEYTEDYLVGSEETTTDFRNSPQNIYSTFGMMDTVPHTVVLTSSNGARVVSELIDDASVSNTSIVLGSFLNAASVGQLLQDADTYSIHTAGSHGSVAIEDEIARELIKEEMKESTIEYESVLTVIQELPIERVFGTDSYSWLTDEDIHHATNINSTSIIPSVSEDGKISKM